MIGSKRTRRCEQGFCDYRPSLHRIRNPLPVRRSWVHPHYRGSGATSHRARRSDRRTSRLGREESEGSQGSRLALRPSQLVGQALRPLLERSHEIPAQATVMEVEEHYNDKLTKLHNTELRVNPQL